MPRRPNASTLPPPLEAACLTALWELGEGTVHDVAGALAPRQKLAYTTVLTLLERLVKRGHLVRRKRGRSFVYAPSQPPDAVRQSAVAELTKLYFQGSPEALRNWLTGAGPARPSTQEPIDPTLL